MPSGQLLMTVAEAKRRFGKCLRVIINACGGVDSAECVQVIHHRPAKYSHYDDRRHPVLLALGRNLPGVNLMIHALARKTELGMRVLRDARISGTDHGLPILAARPGCVKGL